MWVVETAGARIFSSHFAKIKNAHKTKNSHSQSRDSGTYISATIYSVKSYYKHKYFISIHSVKNLEFSNSNDMNPKVLCGSAYIDTSRTK